MEESENVKYKDFPSGEIYMDIAKSEYENELKRTQTIDTKTNISLVVVTAFFFAIASYVHYKEYFEISITSVSEAVWPLCQLSAIVAAFVLVTLSIVWFMRVITVRSYKVLEAKYYSDVEAISTERGLYAAGVAKHYINATIINSETNQKRVKVYQHGVIFAIISIILFALCIILKG